MSSQAVRFAKSTVAYGLGNILNNLMGLLLLPLFTSYLTPADYGVISILTVITAFLPPVVSLGVQYGILPLYFEDRDPVHGARVVWTAFLISVCGAGLMVLCALTCAPWISRVLLGTTHYAEISALALITAAVSSLAAPFSLALQLQERALLFVFLAAITTLVSLVSSIYLVVHCGHGPWGVIEANLLAQTISFALFALAAAARLRFRADWRMAHRLITLGIPMIPSGLAMFLLLNGNRFQLQWIEDLRPVGLYSVGINMGMAMGIAVQAFSTAWNPFFMSYVNKQDEAGILFGRILTWYVLGFGAVALMFFLAAKPVVMAMSKPPFHPAFAVVGLAAGAQFLTGVFYVLLPPLYFARRLGTVAWAQSVAALVALALGLLLVPLYSFLGAALALFAGHLAMVALLFFFMRRKCAIYLQVGYQWRRIVRFTVLAAVLAGISLLHRDWSLAAECGYTAILSMVMGVAMWWQLELVERTRLREYLRTWLRIGSVESGGGRA